MDIAKELDVGDLKIEIVRKNIKNLHLRVHPPMGAVSIAAPMQMRIEVIQAFALSKVPWIKKQQRRIQKYVYEPEPPKVDAKILRARLEEVVPDMIAHWEHVLSVKVRKVSYRMMKTRWGSCTPDDANVRLNLSLGYKSYELIDYVVLHELVHLLEPSHNARFKSFMDLHMPDWRVRQMQLNGRRV